MIYIHLHVKFRFLGMTLGEIDEWHKSSVMSIPMLKVAVLPAFQRVAMSKAMVDDLGGTHKLVNRNGVLLEVGFSA